MERTMISRGTYGHRRFANVSSVLLLSPFLHQNSANETKNDTFETSCDCRNRVPSRYQSPLSPQFNQWKLSKIFLAKKNVRNYKQGNFMSTTASPSAVVLRKRSDAQKFATSLLVGGVSATVSKTAVAPIERVKILLQVQYSHKDIPADKRFNGIFDAFIRVPKEQGFLSFWRGNLTNVIRYFPTQAFNFAFNDLYKSILLKNIKREDSILSYSARTLVSGGLAGCSSLCIVYPLDFIRTRLSADINSHKNREYKGLVDCTVKTVKNEGVIALYRGFSISLQTYFIYRSVYFGLYDAIRNSINSDKKKLPFYTSFAIAQGVTVLSSYLTYPWDTVRRRMMVRGELSTSKAVAAARKIVHEEGFRGLYKGALANIFRSAGGALVMALYEEIHKHM